MLKDAKIKEQTKNRREPKLEDVGEKTAHAGLQVAPSETELKFYIPAATALKALSAQTRDERKAPIYIEQHVLNPNRLKCLVKQFGIDESVSNSGVFTSVRARRIVESGSERLLIEFKSRRMGDRVSRFEFGKSISEEQFAKLNREHGVGCIRKIRHIMSGTVQVASGSQKVLVELDQVLDAGSPAKPLHTQFFTADIEAPGAILDAVRRGDHALDWVKGCTILSFANEEIRRALSNKRLACEGFGAPQMAALEFLTEESLPR